MNIKHIVALALISLLSGFAANGTCDAREFGKRLIRHRANIGGDCEDRDNCVGIVGNRLYNYQEIDRRSERRVLKDMEDAEKGKLTIGREGVEIEKATREKFDLNNGDIKDVRNVHQYVEVKRDIKGNVDGKVLDLGSIENKYNRKMRSIQNIVEVNGDIKGVSGGNVGQVTLKKSKMRQISNSATIDGRVNLKNRHSFSVGGVVIENGAVTDGIKSNVIIKGR